jgi:hypothetical protein
MHTLSNIISEVLLIALAAIVGTFIWNHFSAIFSYKYNNKGISLWRATLMDLQKYWRAWVAFCMIMILLVSVVGWRALLEREDILSNLENEIRDMRIENRNNTQDIITAINELRGAIDGTTKIAPK